MSNISGKDGYVTRQVSGVDTLVDGIREWSLTYAVDMIDTTSFSSSGVTHKSFTPVLKGATGTLTGNHTDGDTGLDVGTSYNIMLVVDSNRAYYGAAYITGIDPNVVVDGEATLGYNFQFTGKTYILGADVVVDGDFTAADGSAWDVSDADVAYDATGNQLDWSGDADVVPASNDVITNAAEYWTQMKIENEAGTSSLQLKLGTSAGTERTSDGTYTEFITANSTTFTIVGVSDNAISLSEIIIRPVEN